MLQLQNGIGNQAGRWYPTTTIVCSLCDIEFKTEEEYTSHRGGRDHERAETEKRRLLLEGEVQRTQQRTVVQPTMKRERTGPTTSSTPAATSTAATAKSSSPQRSSASSAAASPRPPSAAAASPRPPSAAAASQPTTAQSMPPPRQQPPKPLHSPNKPKPPQPPKKTQPVQSIDKSKPTNVEKKTQPSPPVSKPQTSQVAYIPLSSKPSEKPQPSTSVVPATAASTPSPSTSSPSTSRSVAPVQNITAQSASGGSFDPTAVCAPLEELEWNESEPSAVRHDAVLTPRPDAVNEILKDPEIQWCPICHRYKKTEDQLVRTAEVLRKHLQEKQHHQMFEGLKLILGGEYLRRLFPLWIPHPPSVEEEMEVAAEDDDEEVADIQMYLDHHEGPLLGLEFVTENRKDGLEERYYCELCSKVFTLGPIIDHIVARQHRENYLKEKHPTFYSQFVKFTENTHGDKQQLAELEKIGTVVEKQEGRRRVRVACDPRAFAEDEGVEYIVEYSMEEFEERYVCELCTRNMMKDKIIPHVSSLLHSLAYVKRHHKDYEKRFTDYLTSCPNASYEQKEKQFRVYADELMKKSGTVERKLVKNGGENPSMFYEQCCRRRQPDGSWANFWPARPRLPEGTTPPAGQTPAEGKDQQASLAKPTKTFFIGQGGKSKRKKAAANKAIVLGGGQTNEDEFQKSVGFAADVFEKKLRAAVKAVYGVISGMRTQITWSCQLEEVYRLCMYDVYQTQSECRLCRKSWKEPLDFLIHIGGKYHAQMQGDHFFHNKTPESNISILTNCKHFSGKYEVDIFKTMAQGWQKGVSMRKGCPKTNCKEQFVCDANEARKHWQQFVHPPIMTPVTPPVTQP